MHGSYACPFQSSSSPTSTPLISSQACFDILTIVDKKAITEEGLRGSYIGYWLKYIQNHPHTTKQARTDTGRVVRSWQYHAEKWRGREESPKSTREDETSGSMEEDEGIN
eukprot:gnl/Chilomastix_caulleri/5266.p1 GENE.gnl/Chilomastix_caulleri/5266~~gnl/Chilomastix_caulleri/5266.p1  ORF type:complete len:110 (+),score=32.46 gnl/Chilomastix_caulleri/5266:187-516(+)